MHDNRKRELAFLYAIDALQTEDRPVVFDLILRDEAFRRYLKEEVDLRSKLQSVRIRLEPSSRSRLYAEMKRLIEQEAFDNEPESLSSSRWNEWMLRITTPRLMFPIIKTLRGDV